MRERRPGEVRGLDGKIYPARYTDEQRSSIVGRCHYLSHDQGRSVREIQRILEDEHNVSRSVGTIHTYLSEWKCERCSGVPNVIT